MRAGTVRGAGIRRGTVSGPRVGHRRAGPGRSSGQGSGQWTEGGPALPHGWRVCRGGCSCHHRIAGVRPVPAYGSRPRDQRYCCRPRDSATATEAKTRKRAAAWVAGQVSRTATVSCDPVMCRALKADRIPDSDLLQLRPGAPAPLRSQVVVATPAIRRQFGNRLESVYAPRVLASFGSGSLRIDIRAIAPHGAAAYESALRADLRARKEFGTALLGISRITVSATARRQLSAGQVDARLLFTIQGLAAQSPVYIMAFSDSGPGASAGIPLRVRRTGAAGSGASHKQLRLHAGYVRGPARATPPLRSRACRDGADRRRPDRPSYRIRRAEPARVLGRSHRDLNVELGCPLAGADQGRRATRS